MTPSGANDTITFSEEAFLFVEVLDRSKLFFQSLQLGSCFSGRAQDSLDWLLSLLLLEEDITD